MKTKTLRLFSALLLLVFMGLGNAILAQTFTYENLNYDVNEDGVSVTLKGSVDGSAAHGRLNIPSTVTYNGHTYPVTKIGKRAFKDCRRLYGSLNIPGTVVEIEEEAFYECSFWGDT